MATPVSANGKHVVNAVLEVDPDREITVGQWCATCLLPSGVIIPLRLRSELLGWLQLEQHWCFDHDGPLPIE